jgi:MYXO-CTERM domain-containing protein
LTLRVAFLNRNAGCVQTQGMRCSLSIAGVLFVLVAAAPARGQVGSGWMPDNPPSSIQLDGSAGIESYPGSSTNVRNEGASFTDMGGIETFALHDPISNRAERRMQNTYQSGRRQFEGEVRVSPPTDDESVQQVFGGNSGATTQMIRAYDAGGGTLRKVPGSVLLAERVHGVWIKVNVIHDTGANFVKTYINGRLMATGDGEATNAGNDGWYHKYGCYGTLRTGSAKVEWRNVKHFRDGTAPPGNGPGPGPTDPTPPPDASADASGPRADAGSGSDAGAGGSGGAGGSAGGTGGSAGGAGGSSGSAGAGGAGGGTAGSGAGGSGTGGAGAGGTGSGGSGGGGTGGTGSGGRVGAGGSSAGTGAAPPAGNDPAQPGCACRTGGPGGGSAGGPFTLLALLALTRAIRRRRSS